jgi:hypothetical protein
MRVKGRNGPWVRLPCDSKRKLAIFAISGKQVNHLACVQYEVLQLHLSLRLTLMRLLILTYVMYPWYFSIYWTAKDNWRLCKAETRPPGVSMNAYNAST